MSSSLTEKALPSRTMSIRMRLLGNPFLQEKKGAPTCAGAPQRLGHCRVFARTVVRGAVFQTAPREELHVVGALRVLGEVETFAFGIGIGAQPDEDVDDPVQDR